MSANTMPLPPIAIPLSPDAGGLAAPAIYARLAERFEPLLAFAMHVRGTAAGRAMGWDAVAAQMQTLADAEAALPTPHGMTGEDIQACRMAAYTFVDEILLASPRDNETSNMGWYTYSLQLARLGSANGGELFYSQLATLVARASDRHPPEIGNLATSLAGLQPGTSQSPAAESALAAAAFFALCFLFGFRGRLFGQEKAPYARELGEAAATLLGRMDEARPDAEVTLEAHEESVASGGRSRWWWHPVIWLVGPVLLTALWYHVCAELVPTIATP